MDCLRFIEHGCFASITSEQEDMQGITVYQLTWTRQKSPGKVQPFTGHLPETKAAADGHTTKHLIDHGHGSCAHSAARN